MEKTFFKSAVGIAVGMALFFMGMAFALVFIQWKAGNYGDAATWAGSSLAGFAFGGTIYIASVEWLERRRRERTLATVRSVDVVMRVTELRKWYSTFLELLDKPNVDRKKVIDTIEVQLDGISIWKMEDLVDLVCVPGMVAADLSAALKIRDTILFVLKLKGHRVPGHPEHEAHVRQLIEMFTAAIRHIDVFKPRIDEFVRQNWLAPVVHVAS